MKDYFIGIFTVVLSILFFLCDAPALLAQGETTPQDFTLEEITVTAERRAENIQSVPASVSVLNGDSLIEMGKYEITQILEDVPNVRATGSDANNITIRGLRAHAATPGSGRVPASTAMYTDEVYEGMGGGYDIGRVEVLRGPQGTLYGRSALGGVVATYTNEPKLNQFSGTVTGEISKSEHTNFQGAVNVPLSSQFALRVAAQVINQEEGYFNPDGGASRNKAGRLKLLYQPSDNLQIILTGNYADSKSKTGGTTPTLTTPTKINYSGQVATVGWGSLNKHIQESLKVSYSFPGSTLTYIGSYKSEKIEPSLLYTIQRTQLQYETAVTPGNRTHTEELRWASNQEDGALKWLLGSSYYSYDYGNTNNAWVIKSFTDGTRTVEDPDPNTRNTFTHGGTRTGLISQFGVFTEDTLVLSDKLQMTAGLRYDKTKVEGFENAVMNTNMNQMMHEVNPIIYTVFQVKDTLKYNDITWKLRFEYNLTKDNLLYASASSGFLPGDVRINTKIDFGPSGLVIKFSGLPMDEERTTAYEVGSKNKFFGNKLQVNGAVFYYDYSGYRNVCNTSPAQMPTWATLTTPLRMIGAEIGTTWLVTQDDKVSFNAGYLDAKITDFPIDPLNGDSRQYLVFDRVENNPKYTTNISYDHTFLFADGSSLVPRLSARWQSGMYLSNLTRQQYNVGFAPYVWQKSYMIADLGVTWTSSESKYSASGYVRNFTDTEYKNGVGIGTTSTAGTTVTVGDPRVWGLSLTVRF
jgi:outer membrane receptor protein involved in Fe transport